MEEEEGRGEGERKREGTCSRAVKGLAVYTRIHTYTVKLNTYHQVHTLHFPSRSRGRSATAYAVRQRHAPRDYNHTLQRKK